MEYEGKGNKNNYDLEKNKKSYNNTFYLVCVPCNNQGDKNEIICNNCGEKMYQKSAMIRVNSKGEYKF